MANARTRRRAEAKRIIAEHVQARRDAGLPEPKWYETQIAPLVILLPPTLLASIAQLLLSTIGGIATGIAVVVILGTGGQVLRGLGEQRKSSQLKALGYYCGGAAYAVTAVVALWNGLPRLLAG